MLVVDDSGGMRAVIGRALGAAGYQVDLASTLAEARKLVPAGYDAVLVDARLGDDRGTDLIAELGAADPGMLRRCLIVTGQSRTALPAGVASLAKPFRLADLLTAVRALHAPPGGQGGDLADGQPAGLAAPPPDAGPPVPGGPMSWRLLSLARRLRARERAGLSDFLHDGPVQDLAAASLELQLLRRSAGPALVPQLDAVLRRLEAVARPIRVLVDADPPILLAEPRLAHTLKQRASWLAAPLTVTADAGCAGLIAAEVDAAVDVAELMLLVMTPGLPPAQAEVEVSVADGQIGIQLALVPGPAGQADGDRTVAYQALRELATALGLTVGSEFGRWRWRAWTTVCRSVPGQGSGIAMVGRPSPLPSQEFPDHALPRPRGLNAVRRP